MARPVWTGTLSFGLVNVPVKAFTAVRDHSIHFHQLEKGTGARIRNQRVSEKSGKPVEGDDIEMGYELRKGRYVTFEKGELQDLKPESTRAVEVTEFVALEEIDPMYYERTYWLAPADDRAKEAYQLLHAAMVERQRVAIGTVVMRNKQYLTAIRPIDHVLAMSTMRFADEVVPRSEIDELPSRKRKSDPKALRLATQIVDSLSSEWDPKRYHDTYTDELEELIARKEKGDDDVVEEAAPKEERADVVDLLAALEASVSEAKSGRRSPGKRSAGRSKGRRTNTRGPERSSAGSSSTTKRRSRSSSTRKSA
jgi:DNA end-binding protein Ku